MKPSTAARTQNGSLKLAGAYVNGDIYTGLVKLAQASNRTLAGQIRHIYDQALLEETIKRACNPRVGDRFIAGELVIEVKAIDSNTEARTNDPACQSIVEYTDSRIAGKLGYLFIGDFEHMVQTAIHNHGISIFHAAEDDEK